MVVGKVKQNMDQERINGGREVSREAPLRGAKTGGPDCVCY